MMGTFSYVWGWGLLAFDLLAGAGFIWFGVSAKISPWIIFGVVFAILNLSLLVVTLLEPLRTEEELKSALRSFFIEGWFYIAGAFAFSCEQYQIAGPAVLGGVLLHIFVTRKQARRLRRRLGH